MSVHTIIGQRSTTTLVVIAAVAVAVTLLLLRAWPVIGQEPEEGAPSKPAGLTGTVSSDAVSLSWDDPGDSSITGYQVLRRSPATQAKDEFTMVEDDTGSASASYTDTTVEPETRYFYRVKARNVHGLSERSGYVEATTPEEPVPTPATPARPTVTAITHDSVTISWTDPGDSSITGYQVLRRNRDTDAAGDFTVIEDDTATSDTGYTDSSVRPETPYVYRVKARNVHGLSDWSGFVRADTPAAPENSAATGQPAITGTARVHETLSADTAGIADANGLSNVEYAYRWVRTSGAVDADIGDATGATYTLVRGDLGHTIKVRVSFTDDDGYEETLASSATGPVVRPPNASPSGLPAITGTVQVSETLNADTSGITDGNGLTGAVFAHQWVRSAGGTDTDISGAAGSTYSLTGDDLGSAIKVRVSFTDDDGYSETLTSNATDPCPVDEDDFPANTTTSGTVIVGGSSRGEIESFGDRDWFSVVLEADHTYRIYQKGLSSGHGSLVNPHLRGIYDSEGVQISDPVDTFGGIGRNSRVTYTPTDGGTYYVSASSEIFPRTNGEGTYELSVLDITNGHPDDFSAGTSTTGTIAVDGKARGNVEFANDRDWFSVTLEADNTYLVELKGRRSDAGTLYNPYLGGIYDAQGDRQRYTTDNNSGIFLESRLLFTPTATGQYFVEAGGYGAVNEGRYTLELTLTPEDDHKAHTGTDSTVAVGGTVPGEIDFAGDEDWFQVTLEALQHYRFDQRGSPSGHGRLGDPYFLGLYDSTGTFIRGTKDDQGGNVGDNSHILYDPTEAGTYYVAAGGYSDSQGTYQLQLRNVTEPDDYPADTSTTGAVSVGSATKGKMEVRFDRDWIGVELESGKTYRLDLRRHGSFDGAKLPDPYLYGIHDADGVALSGTADDNGGIGKNSRVLFIPGQDGTYYVEIGDAGEGQGKYQLKVDEHVDDYLAETGTTGTVEVGGMATGEIEFAGDQDWFSVELEAGRSYEIVLMGFDAGGGTLKDPFLRGVYDGSGALIPNTGNNDQDSSSPDSRSTFAPDGDGTYYLAAGANGAGLGTYKLWVADDTGW